MPNVMNQVERNTAEHSITKDINILFRLERKNSSNVDKIIRDRRLFESDEEDYFEPIRTGNDFSSICIEYESNGDKHKAQSTE